MGISDPIFTNLFYGLRSKVMKRPGCHKTSSEPNVILSYPWTSLVLWPYTERKIIHHRHLREVVPLSEVDVEVEVPR